MQQDARFRYLTYLLLGPGKCWVIELSATKAKFNDLVKLFEKIVASFRLLPE